MGTKKELVHRCASNFSCGASFAALLHTLAELPGVEPHATLVASPGSCCASTSLIWLGARYTSKLQLGRKSPQSYSTCLHGHLEVSLDWILLTFLFPALFTSNPHASKYRWLRPVEA